MSANITVSGGIVDSTGRVVTATLGGGSGSGYTISGVAGLVPAISTGRNEAFVVSSAAIAGTTLTMNLAHTIGQGEAVRLDVDNRSTLSDSGGNSVATGQGGGAMTNNSTVTAAVILIDVHPEMFELNGRYLAGDVLRDDGSVANAGSPDNASVEFVVDATEVSIISYASASSSARVDGAVESSDVLGNNGAWQIKPVAVGMSSGKHLIRLQPGDFFGGVRLVGGARTITTVPTTKVTVRPNTRSYAQIPQASPVKISGEWWAGDEGSAPLGFAYVGGAYGGFELEVGFTGSGIELATVTDVFTGWAVGIDDAEPGGALVSGGEYNNTNNFATLAAGLPSGSHFIRAVCTGVGTNTTHKLLKVINGTATTGAVTIGATTLVVASAATLTVGTWVKIGRYSKREFRKVTAISGTTVTLGAALEQAHDAGTEVTSYEAPAGTLTAHSRTRTLVLAALGDSNTQGANEFSATPDDNGDYFGLYDPRQWPGYRAVDPADWEVINLGIQGQRTSEIAARGPSDLATYARGSFDALTLWTGTNEINQGSGDTTTPSQYRAYHQTMIDAALPKLRAGGKIYLLPPGTPGGNETAGGLNLTTAATQLAALAAADPTHVVFVDDFLDTLVEDDYDNLHYKESGRIKLANKLAAAMGIGPTLPVPGLYLGTELLIPF